MMANRIFAGVAAMLVALSFNAVADEAASGVQAGAEAAAPAPSDSATDAAAAPQAGEAQKENSESGK